MSDSLTLGPVNAAGSPMGTGDPGIALYKCSPTMPLTIEVKGVSRGHLRPRNGIGR